MTLSVGDSDPPLRKLTTKFSCFVGVLNAVYSSTSRTKYPSEFWRLAPLFCLINFRVPNINFRVPNINFRVLNTNFRVPNTNFRVLNTNYGYFGLNDELRNSKCLIISTVRSPFFFLRVLFALAIACGKSSGLRSLR
ncbi:MAG: hypothetical protein V7L04_19825 [Nostoc sp.]